MALEVDGVAGADPGAGRKLPARADPGLRLRPVRLRRAAVPVGGGTAARDRRGRERWHPRAKERRWACRTRELPGPARQEIRPSRAGVAGSRALTVASRLLAGATTFFFLAFFFAYFYLRSINVDHMWRPAHVKPDQGLGAAFIVCMLISALLAIAGRQRAKGGSHRAGWRRLAGAVAFGLIAWPCSASSTRSSRSARPTAPSRASSAPGPAST